LKGISNRN